MDFLFYGLLSKKPSNMAEFNKTLILLILLISVFECMGQSCLKRLFSNPGERHLYIFAVIFYSAVCFLLLMSYRYKSMGLTNILWSGMSVIVIVSTGMVFFGETVTRMDVAGILLILMGMALVFAED